MLRLKEDVIGQVLSNKQLGIRQNQLGLVKGAFTGINNEYLVLDYQRSLYKQFNSLTETYKVNPALVRAFCDLFGANHKETNKECVRL